MVDVVIVVAALFVAVVFDLFLFLRLCLLILHADGFRDFRLRENYLGYFGDLIMYAGLGMLTGDLAAVVLAILGAVAIVQQCKIEERALSERFKAVHERWKSNTRLIVPFLL